MMVDAALITTLIIALLAYYSTIVSPHIVEPLLILGGIFSVIPIGKAALRALQRKNITVDLLASVALVFAFIDRQWSSVAFISLMITSARIFGRYTQGKARAAIQSLLKLRPEMVRVKKGKDIVLQHLHEVKRGDHIVIQIGDRIPVDGVVIEGTASIDQSSLTGESIPVVKNEGEMVFSSTLNVSGFLIVKTTKIGQDTTLEKIIHLVDQAQSGKARIQTIGDWFAARYIMLTFFGSIGLFLLTKNASMVLSILLVTCADDIAVAIPLAFWGAVGYAAKRGIIVKGGNFLEGLTQIHTLVVDKTGTITQGKISVHTVIPQEGIQKEDLVRVALTPTVISKHPISRAIFSYGIHILGKKEVVAPDQFHEYPGKGIIAYAQNERIVLGNFRFFKEQGFSLSYDSTKDILFHENHGFTVVLVGKGKRYIGMIALSDELRDHIHGSITQLRRRGIDRIVMISGDNERVTKRIAEAVGITEYYAAMMPEEKVAFIEKNARSHGTIAMVGDGVNDAAALSRADIGIAMGVIGSDAAIESSDIALMKDDFSKIAEAMTIGTYTMNIARENFIIWGVVNGVGLILVFGGVIGPQGAAAYNFLTDFIPLLNSMRVFRYHLFPKLQMKI